MIEGRSRRSVHVRVFVQARSWSARTKSDSDFLRVPLERLRRGVSRCSGGDIRVCLNVHVNRNPSRSPQIFDYRQVSTLLVPGSPPQPPYFASKSFDLFNHSAACRCSLGNVFHV